MENFPGSGDVPRTSSRSNFGIPPRRFGFEGQEDLIPRPPLPLPRTGVSRAANNDVEMEAGGFVPVAHSTLANVNVQDEMESQRHHVGAGTGRSSDVLTVASSHSSARSSKSASTILQEMKIMENDEELERLERNLDEKIRNVSHRMARLRLENTMLQRSIKEEGEKTLDEAEYLTLSDLEVRWSDDDVPEVKHADPRHVSGGREAPIPKPRTNLKKQIRPMDRDRDGDGHEYGTLEKDMQRYFPTPKEEAHVPVPKPWSRRFAETTVFLPEHRKPDHAPVDRRPDRPPVFRERNTGPPRTVRHTGHDAGQRYPGGATVGDYPEGELGNPPAGASGGGGLGAVDNLAQAILTALSSQNRASERFIARQSSESKLPIFAGNPLDWPLFINHYRQSTRDCGYTPAQNMGRLEKCIKGEARRSIQALMIVPNNADQVISALEQRYGRPEYIIEALVNLARSTPAPKETKLASIMDYANAISNLVITVETMNVREYLWNPHLLKELVDKLPDSMKLQWGETVVIMRGRPTLVHFSDWISGKAKAISAVAIPKFSTATEKKGKPADLYAADEETTSVAEPQSQKTSGGSCPVCSQTGHRAEKCGKLTKLNVDKKWELVKKLKLCFRCLKVGHSSQRCRSRSSCGIDGCKRYHHSLLHNKDWKKESTEGQSTKGKEEEAEDNATIEGCSRDVLLRIVPVKLYGKKTVSTFAIFDDCSTVTLMTKALAEKLELDGPTDPLRLKWTNGQKQEHNSSKRVSCRVSREDGGKQHIMKNIRTVEDLNFTPQSYQVDMLVERWPHLGSVKMPDLKDAKPAILIGQCHQHLIVARRIIEKGGDSPMLTNTKLGWVLHGPTGNGRKEEITFHCEHESDDDIIHRLVKESFQLDSIGIQTGSSNSRSREDKKAEALMEQVTRRVGQRWETGLLWKDHVTQLPESKMMAVKRLNGIENKLFRNKENYQEYKNKIMYYLEKGYARKLSPAEAAISSPVEWYLPHFGTFHPNKPRKLRIVFDAKSKSRGMSLNDALMTGPDLLVSLPGVLLKCRQKRIAFSGDIGEMFHQVEIRREDCPAQRFLWRNENGKDVDVFQLERMMFGSVCSPYCAQYVKNKNALEFEKEFPAAAKAIVEHHYMDDWIECCDTWEEAEKLIHDVVEVHSRGGFQIGKWISNSKQLLEKLNPDAGADTKNLTEWSEIATERVLGLYWDPAADQFTFRVNLQRAGEGIADGSRRPTKREVLRLIMLIFDPLGFLSHFLVKARILLQQLWRSKIGWDDEITTEQWRKWKQWLVDLEKIHDVSIPRCYSFYASSAENIQLHIFADAGELAYCAIAFLRVDTGAGVDVSFVFAKTRVAPLKHTSVPRLELQAALAASRMGKFMKEQLDLKVDSLHYWTDSRTVLHWIRSDSRRFHQFVATRIGEIHENTDVADWSWVPTKENVADDGTRDGQSDLSPGSRWWRGPPFLKLPVDNWPREKDSTLVDENVLEIKKNEETYFLEKREAESFLPKLERFSKWNRLVRSTAYVLKAIPLLAKMFSQKKHGVVAPQLHPEDLEIAERLLIQSSQLDDYAVEMDILRNGGQIPKKSKLYQLSPFLDKTGVLKMNARTVGSDSEGLRTPIILNPNHRLTKLIILEYHRRALHQGQDQVRNELRQKFYIPHLREAVKKSWNDCMECRRRRAKPVPPPMGHLPEFRVQKQSRCFSICGMDYFGPMDVIIGRRHEKRYGVLFTCMNTRAVHLEVAHSLSTDSCIMAIRRMIGRRGQPKEIFSDNGTNLRGADKELRMALEAIEDYQMTDTMTSIGIKWNFIPPSAPHFGGTWERLVKSVKTAMGAIMKSRAVKEEVLQTVFVEAEAVVNSRPLTDIPVDAGSEALTPMHFIIGSSSAYSPPGEFDNEDLDLQKQWRKSQRITDMFWKRWVREYLPTLQKRTKWFKQVPALEKGDMVIIIDESLRRNTWPLGIVTEVFPGPGGAVRVAEVKTAHGTYRRPVVKIARLDIKAGIPSDDP